MAKPNSSSNAQENAAAAAPKSKIKNKTVITLIVVVAVIVAIALFAINLVRGKVLGGGTSNEATLMWQKIADDITYMVESSDMKISYVNSDKRTLIALVGSEAYYGVRFDSGRLYITEGSYTSAATTDALKLSEADTNINGGKYELISTQVSDFSVENYNAGTDSFSDGTVKVRFRIETGDGSFKQDTLSASIPVSE